MKVELVVDASGSLKVAAPSLLKELLKGFGIGVSVEVGANWVSTSSITLNFANVADKEE